MTGDTSLVASSFIGRISARSSLMSSRDYKATVQLLDDNETIYQEFKKSVEAQQILDYVCDFLNIVEEDYFGLRSQGTDKHRYWLDLNKAISKQVRGPNVALLFRVRFYPSDVTVLKEEITRYQLFVQLQRDLLHGRLCCSQNEAAILGALILQAVIGDYDAEPRSPGYVSEYKLLPKQTAKLEEKVAEEHKHFKGLTVAEAEMEFLKKASKLETYGIDPYAVTDKQGQALYVGAAHRGVYIFHAGRVIHHISWEQLQKVDYLGKALFITPVASYVPPDAASAEDINRNTKAHISKSTTLKLHCPSATFAKHLWRHILSQQAFFTENDAKHIKPKFSKPRIPLLSRGSTFRFPVARVLHEIELEAHSKREGPQPTFTRYTLQRQPPRQQLITKSNRFQSVPIVRLNNGCSMTIAEDASLLDQSELCIPHEISAPAVMETEEEYKSNNAAVDKEYIVSEHVDVVLTPPVKWLKKHSSLKTTFTIHLSRIEALSSQAQDKVESEETPHLDKPLDLEDLKPISASTPISNIYEKEDANALQSSSNLPEQIPTPPTETPSRYGIAVSALNVVFSFVLLGLFLIATIVAVFEGRPSLLDSSPTAGAIRHSLYDPLRAYIIAVYERFMSK
uniref:FERM domain-containing protein n=1 Tax=Parascaris univalens TaxID=6257 RepID=A0A915BW02_PARUN